MHVVCFSRVSPSDARSQLQRQAPTLLKSGLTRTHESLSCFVARRQGRLGALQSTLPSLVRSSKKCSSYKGASSHALEAKVYDPDLEQERLATSRLLKSRSGASHTTISAARMEAPYVRRGRRGTAGPDGRPLTVVGSRAYDLILTVQSSSRIHLLSRRPMTLGQG